MGACMSTPGVTPLDLQLHRDAEKQLRETKSKLESERKVLLLGAGDSGKSTVQKQMRFIHNAPFTADEKEHFRKIVFDNLTRGLQTVIESLDDLKLVLDPHAGYANVYPEGDPEGRAGYVRDWAPGECGGPLLAPVFTQRMEMEREESAYRDADGVIKYALAMDLELIESAPDLVDGEAFPLPYLGALSRLWNDPLLREAWARGNQAALPENLPYMFSSLSRFFAPSYIPSAQDILQTRARTIGISETTFRLGSKEIVLVDVGGQKSERRKWVHCFQDVTSILFIVSLSGYDQCLVEDRTANQMHDAMTIWESICHSKWFKTTSVILFLNKDDLYQEKIKTSPLRKYFPEYEGPAADAAAGHEFFKTTFAKLAKRGKGKQREVYTHITTATDTAMLKVVMAAVTE
ncbi:Heterotrimeric G-protein alpha subunit 4 [Mycena chlorophos]|uniref:Heterotrimeric G-protein alpha subunit 4 n=1 Tax=Mycena chlorophos TaxID=658473 RepID=A0A8H6SCI8_MYCCL|nr:Heterotrimeric G-protein alpha subunit 4 [Mycena chlorophos]